MSRKFIETAKFVRHSNAVAAGATAITPSAGVDTKGFRRCVFQVEMGAIVADAVTSLKVQQSDDDGVADAYSDLAGTNQTIGDGHDSGVFLIEVCEPAKRYLKVIVSRATQNATLEGITAILLEPDVAPVTQPATVKGAEFHQTPAEGTA